MTDLASLELCKELYEVSGWSDTKFLHARGGALANNSVPEYVSDFCPPAYTLGYLLRKLPPFIDDRRLTLQPVVVNKKWCASYDLVDEDNSRYNQFSKDPEDAVCKLAIELFEQGVLK